MITIVDFIRRCLAQGMPMEKALLAAECLEAAIDEAAVSRRASSRSFPSGPKERWGYDGPITPMLPEREWLPLRMSILERDGFVCVYCGDAPAQMCVDHQTPLSRGGSHDPSNLVACCLPCNSSKGDKLLSEWEGRYRG